MNLLITNNISVNIDEQSIDEDISEKFFDDEKLANYVREFKHTLDNKSIYETEDLIYEFVHDAENKYEKIKEYEQNCDDDCSDEEYERISEECDKREEIQNKADELLTAYENFTAAVDEYLYAFDELNVD